MKKKLLGILLLSPMLFFIATVVYDYPVILVLAAIYAATIIGLILLLDET